MMPIVQLTQASKQYRDVCALQGLDLQLEEGEVLGLFGHNGAGKTTTIKLILGLIAPSTGKVRVFGGDPTARGAREHRRRIGFLQENVSFYGMLTGAEVLHYFARLKKLSVAHSRLLLEQVGLAEAAHRKVRTYSKGMRQRLGLAQAMLGEPRLLLLDEPTVGLDPLATQAFYQSIEQLKQRGCAVVLCSHALPGVEKYIDRAAILGQGRLLAHGCLDTLRTRAALPLTLSLEGEQLAGQLPAPLAARAQPCRGGVALQIPPEEKLAVLRQLVALPGLTDLNIQVPSLDDLYHYFTAALQPREEH